MTNTLHNVSFPQLLCLLIQIRGCLTFWRRCWSEICKPKPMCLCESGWAAEMGPPSPQSGWPCRVARTWSAQSPPAGHLLWTRHHSPCGWLWHSARNWKKEKVITHLHLSPEAHATRLTEKTFATVIAVRTIFRLVRFCFRVSSNSRVWFRSQG